MLSWLRKMSYRELQAECKLHGLRAVGSAKVLRNRLVMYVDQRIQIELSQQRQVIERRVEDFTGKTQCTFSLNDYIGKYVDEAGGIRDTPEGPMIGFVPFDDDFTPGWVM